MDISAVWPLIAILAVVPFQSIALAQDPRVPRYGLRVGQELTYEGKSESAATEDQTKYVRAWTWHVWVTRRNDDGSNRLLIQQTSSFKQVVDSIAIGGEVREVNLAWCDLQPDSTIAPNPTIAVRVNPISLFPPLAKNEAAARTGWSGAGQEIGSTISITVVPTMQPTAIGFKGVIDSPTNRIYGITQEATYTFDTERGVITRAESAQSQSYGVKTNEAGLIEMRSMAQTDPDTLAKLNRDADLYFQARQTYEQAADAAKTADRDAATRMAAALAELNTASEKAQMPVFKEQFRMLIERHDTLAKHVVEEAQRRAEVVGQASPDWVCSDFAGKSHALKDYRGKVVVLDFWYRGCGWCIRAMPQVKQLAADFAGRPVAFLGMNTDRNDKDAQFVIDAMGLNYPNLKAAGIPGKYRVQGFPTLVIIDQEGIVRGFHEGYAPDLREHVSTEIKALLKNPPAPAQRGASQLRK